MRTVQIKPHSQEEQFEISLDISDQVLRLAVPDDRDYPDSAGERKVEAQIGPSFQAIGPSRSPFLSAAALAFKAKQFDDGIYAAVELAATRGTGKLPAKATLIKALLERTLASGEASGAAIFAAAAELGGEAPDVPADLAAAVEKQTKTFLCDPCRSKPLGFYTWSEEHRRVFRRDRMLQTELGEGAARSIAAALSADPALLKDYRTILDLAARITNPFAKNDLDCVVESIARGEAIDTRTPVCAFPPSRGHETDLVKQLFGNRPIPDGFDLAEELIRRIRDGSLKLEPDEDSGWYDHQTYALEPLAVPDKMVEAKWLTFEESYRRELSDFFKALLALTRETHVKQLEFPEVSSAPPGSEVVLEVSPGLTVEPLPSHFLRRAQSYRFIRRVLEDAVGDEAVHLMRRFTAEGPVDLPLDEEIRLVEALFHGAYLDACGEIGMEPERDPDLGCGKGPAADRMLFEKWKSGLDQDPDLARDIRMMVPVFYDVDRQKTKVWAVLGVASKPLLVEYESLPRVVSILRSDGTAADRSRVRIEFEPERHEIAYPVSAEVYVDEILDRDEFRAHCDRHGTFRAIVENLR